MRRHLVVAAALLAAAQLAVGCGGDEAARVRPLSVGVSSDRSVIGVTASYATSIVCAKDPAGVELAIEGDTATVTALITSSLGSDDGCTDECDTVYRTLRLDEPLPENIAFVASESDEPGCGGAPVGPVDPELLIAFDTAAAGSSLTVGLPCANRFMAASDDSRYELTVEWSGGYLDAPDAQITERTVLLPDPDWTARFQIGHDLAAQVPCTDVIAEDAAVATIDRTYEVTGRLEIAELPADTDGLAVATLHDGSFTLQNGTVVRLGTMTLENPRFGFLAG